MATLTTLRDDLKDIDSGDYAWTNDELDRHILRAVKDLEVAWPYRREVLKNGDGSTRRFTLSGETGFIYLEQIEYEIDKDPAEYLPFYEEQQGIYYIRGATVPDTGTNNIKFWYAATYTVTTTQSDVEVERESGMLRGAWAYAVTAFSRYALRRVTLARMCRPVCGFSPLRFARSSRTGWRS